MLYLRKMAVISKHFAEKINKWAKKVTFPFLDGVPIYNVSIFFWRSIVDGLPTDRGPRA